MSLWINDARSGRTNTETDVITPVELGNEEGDVKIPGKQDFAGYGVNLVNHVHLGGDIDELLPLGIRGVDKGLGEDLFRPAIVVSKEFFTPDDTELGGCNDRRVEIVVSIGGYND